MITETNKILKQNNEVTSSLDIAALTNKRHDNVLRDIKILDKRHDLFNFEESEYTDKSNRKKKHYLLNDTAKSILLSKYKGALRIPLALEEEAALKTIEQLLSVVLERQYRVGSYRIDGYDKANNIAYEIDEIQHKYNSEDDSKRQSFIENELGCKFVRIDVSNNK